MTTQRRFDAVRRLKNSVPWDGPLSDVPTIAARVLDAPVSLLTLLDETCLRVVCRHGVDLAELPLEPGLCQSCMEEDAILILEDASRNDRARSNSLVAGSVGVRCYVGVPIRVEGCAVGALRMGRGSACWRHTMSVVSPGDMGRPFKGRRPLGRDRRRLGAAPETRPWFSRPCLRSCPDFQNGFEPRIVHS